MKAKKRKVSPVTLSVLIGLGGVIVLALGMFLLVLPQSHEAASVDEEIAATQTQITEARLAAQPKTPQPIHVANLFKLVKAMPDNADMPGILLQLNQTASDAGIDFDSITPQAIVTSAAPVQVPINLEFTGNFYDLNDFLFRLRSLVAVRGGALQASGRLFSVDTIEFTEGAGGFPNIGAKLTVRAYVYGSAAAAAPVAPAPATTPPAETTPSDTAAVASGATGSKMASKANALDPKVIAAKKKKQAIVLGALFLAVLAFQGPRTLKMLNKPSPTAAPASPAPVTPAPTTPGAPTSTAAGTTGQTVSASVGADSLVVNADLQPAPLEGQLPDLTAFSTKDPFVPQGGDKKKVAAPSTSGTSGKGGSTGADKAGTGGTGDTGTGTGGAITPSKPTLPAAPKPTSAVLSVNGVQETVNVNSDFPSASPLFHLISLTAKSAKISIAGGSLATGAPAVTIQIGKPTTLMNTADGTRFVIVLVSTGESTSTTPATP